MKTGWLVVVLMLSLLFLASCDFFAVDEEALEIAKNGVYTDCDSLDTSENKDRVEECYRLVGERQDDVDACRAISSKNKNDRSRCFEDVAVDTHDESLCVEVDAIVNKRECYVDIGVHKKDPHLCMNLEGGEAHLCYKSYAQNAGDSDACLSIPHNDEIRDECFMQFLSEATDESFCDKLDLSESRDTCYLEIAKKTTGNLLCNKIGDDEKKTQCHIVMAQQTGSLDECNRMDPQGGTHEWNVCATQVAIVNLDSSYCDTIQDASDKQSCERQLLNAQIQEDERNEN